MASCFVRVLELAREMRLLKVGTVNAIPANIGNPCVVLADNGYLNEKQVRKLEGDGETPAMEVLVSVHAEAKQLRRRHDFRPQSAETKEPPQIRSAFVLEMKAKMEQDEARRKYRLRKQTAGPVFGTIKKWMGFTQFQLRGLDKVDGEWKLLTLAYNVKRLWAMKQEAKKPPSRKRLAKRIATGVGQAACCLLKTVLCSAKPTSYQTFA